MSQAVAKFTIVNRILNNFEFDDNVINIILTHYWNLLPKRKVLLDWIDVNNLFIDKFSSNPNAIDFLREQIKYENSLTDEEYKELYCNGKYSLSLIDHSSKFVIDWGNLSSNRNAIELLTNNQDKIIWHWLSLNKNAIELLKNNQDKIDWGFLSMNNNAIELLKNNQDKIYWRELSANSNAIELLTNNQDKIDWGELSENPSAIELLKNNYDKINWYRLCANPNAIQILKDNINKLHFLVNLEDLRLCWILLSGNINAIELLKNNLDKIDWQQFSRNPSIFTDEPMPEIKL